MNKISALHLFNLKQNVEGQLLICFFKDGTKLKIPSENILHLWKYVQSSRYEHFLGTIGGLFQLLIGTNPQLSLYVRRAW